MKDRILEIIKYYNLSSSQFANEIGIQRSAISHILSGRNKPSLDLILKILNKFSEINTDWLILGNGEMIKNRDESNIPVKNDGFDDIESGLFKKVEEKEDYDISAEELNEVISKEKSSGTDVTEDNNIEKIIFFYKNGKFKIYLP